MDVQPDADGWLSFSPDEPPPATLLVLPVVGSVADLSARSTTIVEMASNQVLLYCHRCQAEACEHVDQVADVLAQPPLERLPRH